jgi:hypothetical protein
MIGLFQGWTVSDGMKLEGDNLKILILKVMKWTIFEQAREKFILKSPILQSN